MNAIPLRSLSSAAPSALNPPTMRDPNYRFQPLDRWDWSRRTRFRSHPDYQWIDLSDRDALGVLIQSDAEKPWTEVRRGLSVEILNSREANLSFLSQPPEIFRDDFPTQYLISQDPTVCFMKISKSSDLRLRVRRLLTAQSELFVSRLVVVVENGVEAKVEEEFVSDSGAEGLGVHLTEVWVEEGARVDWVQRVGLSEQSDLLIRNYVGLQAEARVNWSGILSGSKRCQSRSVFEMQGVGAQANSQWVLTGQNRERQELWFEALHQSKRSTSETKILALSQSQSQLHVNARVDVPMSSEHCEAHMKIKGILGSDRAHLEAQPKLEIATDEVVASHGCAISSFDEEQIFYLQSRGLSRTSAESLILQGLWRDTLVSLDDEQWERFGFGGGDQP